MAVGTGDAFHDLFEIEERDIEVFSDLESYNKICRTTCLAMFTNISHRHNTAY